MANPIPNIEYLGACFNIVTMDPLSLASTALTKTIFDFSKTRSDNSFSVPEGVSCRTILKTSYDWMTSVVSSAAELQTTLKQSAEASAGLKGLFEFSGSASYKDIKSQTESRKRSFVYSRALVELVAVSADIEDKGSGLKLEDSFRRAVADLPAQYEAEAATKLEKFIGRFGTHFAWHVTLGGMATQRTSGLASRFLKSSDTQLELKAKAKVVIEKIKAGVGAEQAESSVAKSDNDDKIERTRLEFQGGMGSIKGINDNWVKSLKDEPTIVAAKLREITDLMTAQFFPQDPAIALKQGLLEYAIREWIHKNGEPGMYTAPLAYGESFLLMFKLGITGVYQPPIADFSSKQRSFRYAVKGNKPVYDSQEPTNVIIESLDTRQHRQILSGDEVFLKHGPSGMYLKLSPDNTWNSGKSGATPLVMLHAGDNPMGPRRMGEYFTESDPIVFAVAPLGTSARSLSVNPSGYDLTLGPRVYDFKLNRWDPSDD